MKLSLELIKKLEGKYHFQEECPLEHHWNWIRRDKKIHLFYDWRTKKFTSRCFTEKALKKKGYI
jgi:hypothetical protein